MGWVIVAGIVGLLVFGALVVFDSAPAEQGEALPDRDDRRIGELEARVDNLEAIIVALSRGETTIALSSGGMRDGHKPGLPPLPSPFPIRSIIDQRKRKDLGPEDFHD